MIFWIRTLLRYAPIALAVYWTALFIGTHLPLVPKTLQPVPFFDKWLHLVGYAGLAFLAATAWRARRKLGVVQYAVLLAAIAVYAAIDEALQMLPFVRRHADFSDWVADVIGAAIGLALFGLARLAAHQFGWRIENGSGPTHDAKHADRVAPCAAAAGE
jgi:VanZ family protein